MEHTALRAGVKDLNTKLPEISGFRAVGDKLDTAGRSTQCFCRVLDAFDHGSVFVHCAAKKRVSAFVFLYRVLFQHIAVPEEAERDLHAI